MLQLDDTLRKMSYVYESYRSKGSIDPMEINIVKPGTFLEFRNFILNSTQASANQVRERTQQIEGSVVYRSLLLSDRSIRSLPKKEFYFNE